MKKRILKIEDELQEKIKDLFELYGYDEYKMYMFEKYSLYVEHKDFLVSDKVITFTDMGGELLALRPDVTLSIVKNSDATNSQRLYYCENVFRPDKKNRRFKEIKQLGLEHIGKIDTYEIAENIVMAIKALALCNNDFVLELSHVDFVTAYLKSLGLDGNYALLAKKAIMTDSESELAQIGVQAGLDADSVNSLCKIIKCAGKLSVALPRIKELAVTDELLAYYNDMLRVYNCISKQEFIDKIRVDFSLIAEENYYNGIIMSGFIKGIPKAVLSGGQYDKLLHKFGKVGSAIGFAVYLGEFSAYSSNKCGGVDVLIVSGNADANEVMQEVDKQLASGLSVRVEHELPSNVIYNTLINMEKNK